MGSWLSEREMRLVAGAETASAATPIPTQIVSNGEYLPPKQSETQKRVERRILELADENAKKLGLSRRQFMATGCGMAADPDDPNRVAEAIRSVLHDSEQLQSMARRARESAFSYDRVKQLKIFSDTIEDAVRG